MCHLVKFSEQLRMIKTMGNVCFFHFTPLSKHYDEGDERFVHLVFLGRTAHQRGAHWCTMDENCCENFCRPPLPTTASNLPYTAEKQFVLFALY